MRPETKELTWERGTYCWADDCWNPIKPAASTAHPLAPTEPADAANATDTNSP